MQQMKTRPDEVECDNCGQMVLPADYLFEAEYCTFCKGEDQSKSAETIAVEALLQAADTIERYVENLDGHYAGTDKSHTVGPRDTYRRAWNAADEYAVDSEATGDKFERVTDFFGDVLVMAESHDIAGKDAAEFYRNQAKAMLE